MINVSIGLNVGGLRWCSHHGENDGDGDVMFCRSHFTFCTVAITVSLLCRECRRDNGCHGDGDGSERCYFGCMRVKKQTMASKGKKPRVKWDSEVERKLIDIWADIIEEFDGKLITRKKKEAIATTQVLLPEALLSRCSQNRRGAQREQIMS